MHLKASLEVNEKPTHHVYGFSSPLARFKWKHAEHANYNDKQLNGMNGNVAGTVSDGCAQAVWVSMCFVAGLGLILPRARPSPPPRPIHLVRSAESICGPHGSTPIISRKHTRAHVAVIARRLP